MTKFIANKSMISEAALQEFKKIWLEEFNEEISDERATELGTNLLTLFHYIYRPVKKEWLERVSDDEKFLKTGKGDEILSPRNKKTSRGLKGRREANYQLTACCN